MAVSAAVVVVGLIGAGISANQQSIANKQSKNAAAQQTQALAALEKKQEPTIPLPDDRAAKRSQRRSISRQLQRRGRQSTILTSADSRGALGG